MTLAMTPEEREAFLAGVHVGVLSVEDPGRGPLAVPVWYAYEPGGTVDVITDGQSRKARRLREASRCSLCAQSETPPYRYVSVEGPITRGGARCQGRRAPRHGLPLPRGRDRRSLPGGYGGRCDAQRRVPHAPAHWYTTDFAKQFGDVPPA